MRLTPLKVLIETWTPEDFEKLEEYQEQMEEVSDRVVRKSIEKPDISKPEYKVKWYNLDNYILDSWSTEWDKERDCPIIIAVWIQTLTSGMSIMNINMVESEWKQLLLTLGYTNV